jgi:long-chain acyl-CoA synthetase
MDQNWLNLTDPIFHWAAERPQALALRQGPQTLTYGELAPLVAKASAHLAASGIREHESVGIQLTNSIDHFILTLGLLRLGAAPIEMAYNVQHAPNPELLKQFGVRTVFVEPMGAPVAGAAAVKLDAAWRAAVENAQGDRRSADRGDETFNISLTSGTTGRPTATRTSHREYFRRMRMGEALFAGGDVLSRARPPNLLLIGGLAFSLYFLRAMNAFFIGGAITLLPEFQHAIDLVRAIGQWDDAICVVPSALCRVLISCAPESGVLYPHLRALLAGGGFVYPDEKLAMLARVTPHFYELYGSSGSGPLAVLKPAEMREHVASVGKPPPDIQVQVVDESGRVLPAGEGGRLRFRYSGGALPGATASGDGWYYPGDNAHLDAAGYIHIRGRSAEMVRRQGVEFFAAEIEGVIAQHPGVAEVAVVGVPSPVAGDEVVALVVPRGSVPHDALAQFCQARLPQERWPDRVFYTGALPKTASGKLDRNAVKNTVMAEIARRAGQG